MEMDFVHRTEVKGNSRNCRRFVEAVAGSQDFELRMIADEFLDLTIRSGGVQLLGTVFNVFGPIFQFVACGPGKNGETTGVAVIAEMNFRKLRWSMIEGPIENS
jgi:hypothetical protein